MAKFTLPEHLRRTREEHKDSQRYTADVLQTSYQSISNYENGGTVMPSDQLYSFCQYYGVSADSLLGLNKDFMISLEGLSQQSREQVLSLVRLLRDLESK